MEEYTGEENNVKLNNDESSNIAFWENKRILPRDCETSKIVKEYVEKICVNLFKQKGGEYSQADYFEKNFDIVVADSQEMNAFHFNKSFTKDGKTILCVNKGLFDNLDNEAQLAFVLAHELGHFTLEETRTNDKYGVHITGHEHEVTADKLGFETMIQGGYNPDEATAFFDKINGMAPDLLTAYKQANDSHGSVDTRIANIKDFKSVAEISGIDFPTYTGEESLKQFQQKLNEVKDNDHYIGYLEKRIRDEFGVASSNELSKQQRLDYCEKIITNEPNVLSTGPRCSEFARLLSNKTKSINKEEAVQINRILEKCYETDDSRDEAFYTACVRNLPKRDENGDIWLEPRGILKNKIEMLEEYITDQEKWEELKNGVDAYTVSKIKECAPLEDFAEMPKFKLDNPQKGDTVPWAGLANAINVNNRGVEGIMSRLGVHCDYFEKKFGNDGGYIIGQENNMFCDGNGVIISTDPQEVEQLHAQSREAVKNLSIDEQKRQMILDFHDQLAIMHKSEHGTAEYEEAKAKASEIYEQSKTAFAEIDNTYNLLTKDRYWKIMMQRDDLPRPSVQVFENRVNDKDIIYVQRNNPQYMLNFSKAYIDVVVDTEMAKKAQVLLYDYHTKNECIENAVDFVYSTHTDFVIPSDYVSFTEEQNAAKSEAIRQLAPKSFDMYAEVIEHYSGSHGGHGPSTQDKMHMVITRTLMNDDVGINGNLPYVEEFRKRMGLPEVNNTEDLIAAINHMKPSPDKPSGEAKYTKLLYDYEIIRAINNGVDVNIEQALETLPSRASPALSNKITEYVMQNDMFAAREGETAEQTYNRCKNLYIAMTSKSAFSSQDDTQYKVEKQLLGYMQKLPPERQAEEAKQLLCTQADKALAGTQIDNSILSDQSETQKAKILSERLKEMGGSILRYDNNRTIAENIYADALIKDFGKDDKSPEFREKVNEALDDVADNMAVKSKKRICSRVAKGIMAQEQLAYDIKDIAEKTTENNAFRGAAVRGFNVINTHLKYHPYMAVETMNFLLSNGGMEDCKKFSAYIVKACQEGGQKLPEEWEDEINKRLNDNGIANFKASDLRNVKLPEDLFVEQLSALHQEYLNANFETRTVIMHRVLDHAVNNIKDLSDEEKKLPVAQQDAIIAENRLEAQISYVSDKIFGTRKEDAELLQEVRKIATAVCHQEEQPSLLLGGILAGREPGQADENMNVGDGLTMFCEKKGTAWVKLAQTLSYVDQLPQDVRNSLSRLKDKANEPEQWEIWTDLREALPDKEFNRIQNVDRFIGGGTFNKTFQVTMTDENGENPQKKVIQVMHDKASTKSEREFKKINGATSELCGVDKKYEILKSIVDRSAKNAKIEVDINEGAKQYENACRNYGAIESVELNGVTYVPHIATWETYGESKFSNYKMMEMAPGKSIDSPDFTPEQKRDMAMAYTMIELTNLMSGKEWDIDRHSKQQNFHITKDKDGKPVVEIGIFDTGAQRAAPTRAEKKLLGRFLIAVVKEQQKGKDSNLSEFMLEKIKKFEKAGKDVNYVSDVQRGLLALSDVMKHMNTPENPNGMTEGLMTCFSALHKNNLIDKTLYSTLICETLKSFSMTKMVFNKLREPTESKDKLTLNMSKDDSRANQQINASKRSDKPIHETDAIELEKTRIRPKPKTPKEQVEKILSDVDMPKGTYMLLTPDDAWLKTTYNGTSRSISSYFNEQESAKKEGAEILMGTNNGYTALYFAKQNIYVVSPGYELANKMYYKAGCKNVLYGVMFSNSESFTNSETFNKKWEKIKTDTEKWRNAGYDNSVLKDDAHSYPKAAFTAEKTTASNQLTAAVCKKDDISFEKISFESLGKSSDMIMLQDYDLSDKNLLAVKNVCCKNCKISAKTELPDYAVLENVTIPNGMDLSRMEKVAFINCTIGDEVKLPPVTHIKNCVIPGNINTSECRKELKCINCKISNDIALPQGAKLIIDGTEKDHPIMIEGIVKKAQPKKVQSVEPKAEVKTPEPVKQTEPNVEIKTTEQPQPTLTKAEIKAPEPVKQTEPKVEIKTTEQPQPTPTKAEVKTQEPVKQTEPNVEIKTTEQTKEVKTKKTVEKQPQKPKSKSVGKSITDLRGLGKKKKTTPVRKTTLDKSKIRTDNYTK